MSRYHLAPDSRISHMVCFGKWDKTRHEPSPKWWLIGLLLYTATIHSEHFLVSQWATEGGLAGQDQECYFLLLWQKTWQKWLK